MTSVTLLPTGDGVAYGTVDGRIIIHDLAAEEDILSFRVRPETEEITCVAVSPDGQWIAAAGTDQEFGIWGTSDGRKACIANGHDVGRIRSLEFHPTDDSILSSSTDRTARLGPHHSAPAGFYALWPSECGYGLRVFTR